MAYLAKLKFKCEIHEDSYNFSWSGYNDSLYNYVIEVLERIVAMKDYPGLE